MWIQSIKLKNFKSYSNAEFSFPEPADGRNIVLIGAVNGHGKTTLLEAIYLCLYGEEATPHLKRAGIPSDKKSYDAILKDALHHQSEMSLPTFGRNKFMTMSVSIVVMKNKTSGVRIDRSWAYDADRTRQHENDQCRMWFVDPVSGDSPIDPSDFKNVLNDYALPFSYAPFFFFDGEKIVTQAEAAGTGLWLKDGLEGLCGITLLADLKDDLQKYVIYCLKDISDQDKKDLEAKQKELETERNLADQLSLELEALKKQKNELENLEDELRLQLGGGVNAQSTQELLESISKAKIEIQNSESKIAESLKSVPLSLIPKTKVDTLKHRLRQELNRLNYESSKAQGENKIDDFMLAFTTNPKALEVVGPQTLKSENMREAIRDAWNKLWYPLPENCAENIDHNYLTSEAHSDIQRVIDNISLPNTNLVDECKKISEQEAEKEKLESLYSRLAGSNNDELLEKLKRASEEHRNVYVTLNGKYQRLLQVELKCSEKERELERLQKRILDSVPNQVKAQRAQATKLVLDELMQDLISMKLDELGKAVTDLNHKLAHDKRIARVKIKSTGDFQLYGENGLEISSALSAGQMQILIMALVSGLAEVTGYQAPYVIDTPLARLDDEHRQGLFKHWSSLNQQVILLSQDTEITQEVKQKLSPSIQKTYLVKAESLSTGGARSTLIENQYF